MNGGAGMTSPHAISLSGSFGGHRIDQLLFSLALPWQENRLGGSPLSLASGQTAPPKGEPRGRRQLPSPLRKEGSPFVRQTHLPLPLGEVARRSRDGEGSSRNFSCIDRPPCREGALRSPWRLCRLGMRHPLYGGRPLPLLLPSSQSTSINTRTRSAKPPAVSLPPERETGRYLSYREV